MPDEKDREKEMETLSRAIVEAIVKSRSVRKAISKLSNKEDLFSGSLMVLMLKLQSLADSTNKDDEGAFVDDAEHGAVIEDEISLLAKNKPINSDIYDEGKKLTPNEAAFRKFLSDNFDQQKWLKRHGLNL
ncbi:hypothetical protein MNBD_NITROSPINAE02-2233 [hydrothermal vent metagenome]|uniref:Uncharacterized protein n=1 Tax=hydrothermal vent metagenome TaxID=652676 RepID=A0A3B1CXS8_9ZZZZ